MVREGLSCKEAQVRIALVALAVTSVAIVLTASALNAIATSKNETAPRWNRSGASFHYGIVHVFNSAGATAGALIAVIKEATAIGGKAATSATDRSSGVGTGSAAAESTKLTRVSLRAKKMPGRWRKTRPGRVARDDRRSVSRWC